MKKLTSSEMAAEMGKLSAESQKEKYGDNYSEEMRKRGMKGWEAVKKKIESGEIIEVNGRRQRVDNSIE